MILRAPGPRSRKHRRRPAAKAPVSRLGLAGALLPLVVALLASVGSARAEEPRFPELSGRVVDGAGLLSRAREAALDERLAAHERASRNQIVVVTVESLQGRSIEEFGYQLGRVWGIGQAGEDNGVLLIVAPNERKVRIEVGYGLEGTLTDALCSNIVHSVILPAFRRGDTEGGIEAGVIAIVDALGGQYQLREVGGGRHPGGLPPIVILLFFALVIGMSIMRTPMLGGRRGMYLGPGFGGGGRGGFGGGFGGGGFGGGGGGFGGGGASGGW